MYVRALDRLDTAYARELYIHEYVGSGKAERVIDDYNLGVYNTNNSTSRHTHNPTHYLSHTTP
jgi:hypothetical protein